MNTQYITVGDRKLPYYSREEILARGEVPPSKLIVGGVYWHIPGGHLFIVKKISSRIEGRLHWNGWHDWLITSPYETYLYPVSDMEYVLSKDTVERGLE